MLDSKRMPYSLDGHDYEVLWQDRRVSKDGFCHRLMVFQNDKLLGYKDLPFNVDKGEGTVKWAIRAVTNRKPIFAMALDKVFHSGTKLHN